MCIAVIAFNIDVCSWLRPTNCSSSVMSLLWPVAFHYTLVVRQRMILTVAHGQAANPDSLGD